MANAPSSFPFPSSSQRRRLCLTQLIDGWNFGRKRENGKEQGEGREESRGATTAAVVRRQRGRGRNDGGGERKGETETEGKGKKKKRERGHTNGLISQQCDLFALYSHKEPILLCHYVTKEGVIAQRGPPVRLRRRRMVVRAALWAPVLSFGRSGPFPPSSTTPRGVSR